MVHDLTDVIQGPGTLSQIAVRFDEQRLVGDVGLLLTGSLAERLGVEQLVNDSVWLVSQGSGRGAPGPQGDEPGARDARRRGQHR